MDIEEPANAPQTITDVRLLLNDGARHSDLALESDREGHRQGKTLIVGVESELRKIEKSDLLIPWCMGIDMVWFAPLVANHIFPKKNAQ